MPNNYPDYTVKYDKYEQNWLDIKDEYLNKIDSIEAQFQTLSMDSDQYSTVARELLQAEYALKNHFESYYTPEHLDLYLEFQHEIPDRRKIDLPEGGSLDNDLVFRRSDGTTLDELTFYQQVQSEIDSYISKVNYLYDEYSGPIRSFVTDLGRNSSAFAIDFTFAEITGFSGGKFFNIPRTGNYGADFSIDYVSEEAIYKASHSQSLGTSIMNFLSPKSPSVFEEQTPEMFLNSVDPVTTEQLADALIREVNGYASLAGGDTQAEAEALAYNQKFLNEVTNALNGKDLETATISLSGDGEARVKFSNDEYFVLDRNGSSSTITINKNILNNTTSLIAQRYDGLLFESVYNDNNVLIKENTYDADGSLINEVKYQFDSNGLIDSISDTEYAFLDGFLESYSTNRLFESGNVIETYDASNQLTSQKTSYLDANGVLVENDLTAFSVTSNPIPQDLFQSNTALGLAPDGNELGEWQDGATNGEQYMWLKDGEQYILFDKVDYADGSGYVVQNNYDATGFNLRNSTYNFDADGNGVSYIQTYDPTGTYTPVSSLLVSSTPTVDSNILGVVMEDGVQYIQVQQDPETITLRRSLGYGYYEEVDESGVHYLIGPDGSKQALASGEAIEVDQGSVRIVEADQTLIDDINSANALLSLANALKIGDPINTALVAVNTIETLEHINGNTDFSMLGDDISVDSLMNVYGLIQGLENGDEMQVIRSAVKIGQSINPDVFGPVNSTLGYVFNGLSLLDSLKSGDFVGALSSTLMFIPGMAPVGVFISLVSSLFGSDSDVNVGTDGLDVLVGGEQIVGLDGQDLLIDQLPGEVSLSYAQYLNQQVIENDLLRSVSHFKSVASDHANTGDEELYGEEGDDFIISMGGGDIINGGAGNDEVSLYGAGNTTVDTGSGDDTVIVNSTGSTSIYTGSGNDTIEVKSSIAINANTGAGNDTVKSGALADYIGLGDGDDFATTFGGDDVVQSGAGKDTVYGGDGADTIDGGDGDDSLYAYNNQKDIAELKFTSDVLIGGLGNDNLYGTAGANVYYYNKGDGIDTIYPNGGDAILTQTPNDILVLGEGILPEDVFLYRDNTLHGQYGDMHIKFKSFEGIIIVKDWFWDGTTSSRLAEIHFSDGTVWQHGTLPMLTLTGTDEGEVIHGDHSKIMNDSTIPAINHELIYGLGGDDVIYGYNGEDTIFGGEGNDILYAGLKYDQNVFTNDVLIGGLGDDVIWGSSGSNVYVYNKGDGKDTIHATGYWTGLNQDQGDKLILGEGISSNDVRFFQNRIDSKNNNLIIKFLSSSEDQIEVVGWYSQHSNESRFNSIEFADGTVWTPELEQWRTIHGTTENDILYGDDSALISIDSAGNITNDYNPSNDDILYGYDGDDTIYGYGGSDKIYGGAGNDTIYAYEQTGGSGNTRDEITGGLGDDTIYGSAGANTYFYNKGDGSDVIYAGGYGSNGINNQDILKLGPDIDISDITLSKNGSDLIVDFKQSGDSIVFRSWWFVDRLNEIVFYDGTSSKLYSTVGTVASDLMVGAYYAPDKMAGGAGDDTYLVEHSGDAIIENADEGVDTVNSVISHTLSENVENLILTGSAAINGTGNELDNFLQGNDADNTLTGAGGDDTLVGGLGNDTVTYTGSINDYALKYNPADGTIRVQDLNIADGDEGTDILTDIETIIFNDKVVPLNIDKTNYLANNSDLIDTFGTDVEAAYAHYIEYGIKENRSTGFYALGYIASYPDFIEAFGTDTDAATYHYLEYGYAEGRRINFDAYGYIAGYADLIEQYGQEIDGIPGNIDVDGATLHYITQGYAAGRVTNNFDIYSYMASYTDLIDAYGSDTDAGNLHYITYGYNENRAITFEPLRYIASYTDLVEAFGADVRAATRHYVEYGYNDGRRVTFDADWYMSKYPDVHTLTGGDKTLAAEHYITTGYGNGYSYTPDNSDILTGQPTNDTLNGYNSNDLLYANAGDDTLDGGANNDLIIGQAGNDTITTGTGADIISFNLGDGQDTITATTNEATGADNTISLGGNLAYSDLSLSKTNNDLTLNIGTADSITLNGWYDTTVDNKSVANLQVIAEAMQGFELGGTDNLRNNKVETFDFANLVAQFDAEGQQANWQLTDARLTAHLQSGSDTEALGGDLAYQYGLNSNLTGMGTTHAQNVITNASFGQTAQTLNNPTTWQSDVVKMA